MQHYFTANPTAAHDKRIITETLRGTEYTFVTDSGVFSKTRVDPGTRLLISALDLKPGETVADIGCGYGPIGVAAAALVAPGGKVYMVDVNERACELAMENILRNGVKNAEVICGDGLSGVPQVELDCVVSNPPIRAGKKVVYGMVDDAHRRLKPGGRLFMVAMTKQGAKTLKAHMEEVFGNAEDVEKGSGYRVIRSEKRD